MEADPEVAARLDDEMDPPAAMLMTYMGVMPFFGAIIIAQSAVVGETQSGTAPWTFPNPGLRSGFILSKLIATSIGVFAPVVVLQGLVVRGQVGLDEGLLPILPCLGTMSSRSLHLPSFLTRTDAGRLVRRRKPGARCPICCLCWPFFVGKSAEPSLPELLQLLPVRLPEQATYLVTGEPIASLGAMISTALCSTLLIVVATRRFQREEF
jgi:hypothetical protein